MAPIFKFLLGESEIDGCNFGDKHIQYKGVFWWRILLRKYLEENTTCTTLERQFLDEIREKGVWDRPGLDFPNGGIEFPDGYIPQSDFKTHLKKLVNG